MTKGRAVTFIKSLGDGQRNRSRSAPVGRTWGTRPSPIGFCQQENLQFSLPEQVENAGAHKGSGQERQQQKRERQQAKPAMLSVQAREVGNMGMAHRR